MHTHGEAFRRDERIAEARRLLLEALHEHREHITGPRAADPALADPYKELLEQAGDRRGRALYFPYLGSGIGKGALVELADGSVKYDFISGIGVHVLGHSHPALLEASIEAALGDTIMQGHLQQNSEAVELSGMLVDLARQQGSDLAHCFLSTSGAMANENALKIAFHNKHPADRLLAFERCFAGRTLALAQLTDKPENRVGLPPTIQVDYIPFYDVARPEESTWAAVSALRAHLEKHPGHYAAMVFELVQGERGSYPGRTPFFTALMDVLKEHDVLVMVDEIQTFGRTSRPFAFQHFELDAYVDLVTIGKMTQVCATLFTHALSPKPGLLSQTFTASTSAIMAARAVLDEITNGDYFGPDGKIARLHAHFAGKLEALAQQHPDRVQGPYGVGAMVAFTPFGGEPDRVKDFVNKLFEAGVIAFMAGKDPMRIRFLLPYAVIDFEDVDAVVAIIEETLAACSA